MWHFVKYIYFVWNNFVAIKIYETLKSCDREIILTYKFGFIQHVRVIPVSLNNYRTSSSYEIIIPYFLKACENEWKSNFLKHVQLTVHPEVRNYVALTKYYWKTSSPWINGVGHRIIDLHRNYWTSIKLPCESIFILASEAVYKHRDLRTYHTSPLKHKHGNKFLYPSFHLYSWAALTGHRAIQPQRKVVRCSSYQHTSGSANISPCNTFETASPIVNPSNWFYPACFSWNRWPEIIFLFLL